MLKPFFPPEVTAPVRLHVAAKRYLCAVNPAYFGRLSASSVHTLRLQGGPMGPEKVREFERNPHRGSAVKVRLWDEAAKAKGLATPAFAHYRPVLERVVAGAP